VTLIAAQYVLVFPKLPDPDKEVDIRDEELKRIVNLLTREKNLDVKLTESS
jgi:hypothetical protein